MRDHDERAAVLGPPDDADDWPAVAERAVELIRLAPLSRSGDPTRGLHPADLAEDLIAAGMDPALLGGGLG